MAYKTFVAGTEGLASDINTYLMNQTVMVFTNAAARNADLTSPTEGMTVYLTASDHYQIYNGTDWVTFDIAWNAYTPTFTNLTLGTGGTTSTYYARIGKTVIVQGYITFGTSPTVGAIRISLPVDVASSNRNIGNGQVYMRDSVAARGYIGFAQLAGSAPSYFTIQASRADATYAYYTNQSATIPHTWTSNDYLSFTIIYQGV